MKKRHNKYDREIYNRCGQFTIDLLQVIQKNQLKHIFIMENISLWDIMAPLLSAFILPEGVLCYKNKGRFYYYWNYIVFRRIKGLIKRILSFFDHDINTNLGKKLDYPKKKNNKRILFLNFTGKHYQETFRDVAELFNRKLYDIKVIGEHVPNVSKRDYLSLSLLNNKEKRSIHKKMMNIMIMKRKFLNVSHFNSLKKRYPLEWKIYKDNMNTNIRNIFPDLLQIILKAQKIINMSDPDIIVGPDDCDYRSRPFFILAKKKKIPTLLIQQGLLSYKTVDFLFLSTDKVAAIGKSSERHFIRFKIPQNRIIITGRPEFDRLIHTKRKVRIKSINRSKEIKRNVLFTSQPFVTGAFKNEESRRKIIQYVYSLSSKEYPIMIKPHPGESLSFHYQMVSNYPDAVLINKDVNTNDLISVCDIFITCSSTTALQAMVADKPVIIINYEGCSEHSPFSHTKAAICIKSLNKLSDTIKALDEKGNRLKKIMKIEREKFVFEHTYKPDGKASERVKNLVIKMIK